MISDLITFVLSNYSLSFLVLGLIGAVISIFRKPKPVGQATVFEALLTFRRDFGLRLAAITGPAFFL